MKSLLVTGSRDWPIAFNDCVYTFLDNILCKQTEPITLINGGAKGVDTWVADYWRANNVGNVITVVPDWNLHGKSAGLKRNIDMINMDPTIVVAFIYNSSSGSTYTHNEAIKRGLKTFALRLDSPEFNNKEEL